MEDSPSFVEHRAWLEHLVATPTPRSRASAKNCMLTHDSPSEHVLRGSKSFAARSFRSRVSGNSLRVPPQKENRSTTDADNSRQSISEDVPPRLPVLGEIQPNNQVLRPGLWRLRPSPTPTLTKKAAEAIVKAHGSPQHVRVTAGGRIVPSEQSPLCHPRYGYSAIKTNGGLVKFAPNHPMGQKQQWTQATQNGFVAQDVEGRLCQIVNGTILPLNEVDGALHLYMPAPNLNINPSRNASFGPTAQTRLGTAEGQQRDISLGSQVPTTEPSSAAQANALELEYSKLEHELKELDKTEVLHGRTMGKAAKDALISKRRELVVSMDNIRKAIKGLKKQPLVDAPTSPRALQANRQSASPPGKSRLPPFLQHRLNETAMPPMPSAFSGFLSALPGGQNGTFGLQTTPSPDGQFIGQPFGMPPGMYVPPPPFDGSISQTFAPYQGSGTAAAAPPVSNNPPNEEAQIPQTDGAWSLADRQKLASPRVSRAINIKAPEPKQATNLKSTLNPMSPAYKPGVGVLKSAGTTEMAAIKSVKDRAPTPPSPMRQLRAPESVAVKNSNMTDDTMSPSKKQPHLHSSSVSSFQTADFFPRNTREYSTRKEEYPDIVSTSEDKENVDPLRTPTTPDDHDSGYTASDPIRLAQTPGFGAPTAPPGTPMSGQATNGSLPININISSVPDRQVNNLSPKGRRHNWTFVQDHPSQESSTSDRLQSTAQDLGVNGSPEKLDFTQASVEWIKGYRAGLGRQRVGADQGADFLDGYCAGVLKSNPIVNKHSNGSPQKPTARRPSPAALLSRSGIHQTLDRRDPTPVRPVLENSLESMDTLKEAIFAPSNENAVLTPAGDGPHVNDASFNLGAWAKHNGGDGLSGFPFPDRSASALHPPLEVPGARTADRRDSKTTSIISSTQQSQGIASTMSMASKDGNRISSMTSIDSAFHRQLPGHRVFSPHLEWRSSTSVSQAAGIATGRFTSTSFDGKGSSGYEQPASITGVVHSQPPRNHTATDNQVMANHSRFREASLDGLSDQAISSPPMSPTLAPKSNMSPSRPKNNSSPAKSGSPAKAKFENIAEKVGIKVTKDKGSPNSPPVKRGWRNAWLGSKKEGSKDEAD